MRVEFVEPFVRAGFLVIETVLRSRPMRGPLAMRRMWNTTHQITLEIGVDGVVAGNVMYGMSLATAQKMASVILDHPVATMDRKAWTAITEMTNAISARAVELLKDDGFECTVTEPSVIRGLNVEVSTAVPALVVQMVTQFGSLEINAALYETDKAKAA